MRTSALLIGCVALLACGDDPSGPPGDPRELILFSKGVDVAGTEIFVMLPDGTGVERLTTNDVFDGEAHWSPDRRRIVFASMRDFMHGYGRSEIHVMNADGSDQRKLTDGTEPAQGPRWSPDGARIAFTRAGPVVGQSHIYVMNADGSNLRTVTSTGYNFLSDWSPDGRHTIAANGTGAVRLSAAVGPGDYTSDGIPVWSPDGQRVAFVSGRDGQYDLYVVSAAGGPATRLTEDSALELPSDWRRPR